MYRSPLPFSDKYHSYIDLFDDFSDRENLIT